MKRYDTINESNAYEEIMEVRKFNPYHGYHGRFASANSATSFTYKPGQGKMYDLAIARERERQAAGGAAAESQPKEYKRLSHKEAKEMAQRLGQTPEQIGKDDVEKIGGYVGTGNSFKINRRLRNGQPPESERDKDTIETMDKHMKPAPEDIVVTRKIGDSFFTSIGMTDTDFTSEGATQEQLDAMVGKVYSNKGYTSTSYSQNVDFFSTRPVTMTINVPKGAKMLVSPNRTPEGRIDENEIVLARGTSMKIKAVRVNQSPFVKNDYTYEVDCEVMLD